MSPRNEVQRIPVARTFSPLDPAGQRKNLPAGKEQQVEQDVPHMLYDAANIMPTAQGYSSFFGKRFVCENNLPPNQEYCFVYEDESGNLTLIALGDTGIWTQGADCDTAEELISGDDFEVTDYAN